MEMRMPEQLSLFDTPEPNWTQQLHRRLDPRTRDRRIAILIDMAQTALHSPMTDAGESDADE
jgi:hypothetical protein